MTACELLADLRGLGGWLDNIDGHLRVNVPKDGITSELRAALTEHKGALLAIVPPPMPLEPCAECGLPYWWYSAEGWRCLICDPDPNAPTCPTCGEPAVRLGTYLSRDGHGRFWCLSEKCLVLWRPVAIGGEVVDGR